jgi:hypothetical protein
MNATILCCIKIYIILSLRAIAFMSPIIFLLTFIFSNANNNNKIIYV